MSDVKDISKTGSKKDEEAAKGVDKSKPVLRETWTKKLDFVMSALSFAVGLGNIWRFPYMAYKYGGGSFLLPYSIMLFVIGLPVFFLELSLGQYGQIGCNKIYGRVAPFFTNLGYTMVFLSFMVALYYIVIISWAVYYLVVSFTGTLPWSYCTERSAPNCCDIDDHNCTLPFSPPAADYFNQVLGLDMENVSFDNYGAPLWWLTLPLLFCWVFVGVILSVGIKSLGKSAYVSTIVPYSLLLIICGFTLSLEGAGTGIYYYVYPDFDKIADVSVWLMAAAQIIFTLSIAMGGLLTLASYNEFDNSIHKDAVVIALGNCCTSVFCGFIVFGGLGFLAEKQGLSMDEVAKGGPTLAFIIYPAALAQIPGASFWSICFFLVLFFLGIQSEMTLIETVVSAVIDAVPAWRSRRPLVVAAICTVGFVLGLPMVCNNGVHMLTVIDDYLTKYCLIFVTLVEVEVVGHFYGYQRFLINIEEMGIALTRFDKYYYGLMIVVVAPLFLAVLGVSNLVEYVPSGGTPPYPDYAQAIGFLIVATTFVIWLPRGLWELYKASDKMSVFRPTSDWKAPT